MVERTYLELLRSNFLENMVMVILGVEVVGRVEARGTWRALSALCAPLRACDSTNEEVLLFIGLDHGG